MDRRANVRPILAYGLSKPRLTKRSVAVRVHMNERLLMGFGEAALNVSKWVFSDVRHSRT
jgi:hypothetical protein